MIRWWTRIKLLPEPCLIVAVAQVLEDQTSPHLCRTEGEDVSPWYKISTGLLIV